MSGTNQQQIDYASIMLQFNNDPNFIKLRDRYATKSFLEIMSTDRSETRHSSFLAWLLEGKDFPVKEQDHPIIHLLDILIRRESEQSSTEQSTQKLVPDEIKSMVLSRNIKSIQIHEVSTEKPVNKVSNIPSQDRLDIYIHCTIELKNEQRKAIEFIIENKIGSKENGPKVSGSKDSGPKENNGFAGNYPEYVARTQTQRYYYALNNNHAQNKNSQKIFIYLTPISDAELIDFDNLGEDQKSKDVNFININYQDILDNIIEPLLSAEDISTRIHTLLEEYVLSLSLPALLEEKDEKKQNIKGSIIMATRKVDIENIENLIKNHNYLSLIKDALKEVSSKNAQNKLLLSFGETYRKLFTAILRVYIETGSANRTLDELDELRSLYYRLLGNPNPKDNTKFSIYYKDKKEKNVSSIGKTSFAITMLKAYIDYHKTDPNTSNEQICKNIHNYCPRQNNKLCVVLLKDWYTKIEEGPKCQKQIPDPKDISIPSSINLTTYVEYQKEFLITNLWAVYRNGGESTFENLLNDICGKTLKDLKQEAPYQVNNLQNNWNKVLAQAGIEKITIYPNN